MSDYSEQYELRYKTRFVVSVGHGKDGDVFRTDLGNAVKFAHDDSVYRRELRAYQILRQRNIDEINGFQIPRFLRNDNELRAIEMSIVRPPFLLDFAASYTFDEIARLEFTEEVMQEREAHWADVFGDRWTAAQELCNAFTRGTGLVLLDLSLNNIKFE